MQQMPKRKNKSLKIILFFIFIGILCFYIYYVILRNKEYDIPDKNNFDFTHKINDTLFLENYNSFSSSEIYLTDSLNFRLFIMFYVFEHQQYYKYKIDDKSITFYKFYGESTPVEKIIAKSYTFEELKTKNNLRKKK